MKVYLCKTLEDAQDFIYNCIDKDITVWRTACWDTYKENTCFIVKDKRLTYADINYCKEQGYEIVEYKKQLPADNKWKELKEWITSVQKDTFKGGYYKILALEIVLDKMRELEKGESDE